MKIRKNWFWGLLFIALAGVLLLHQLKITEINVFTAFLTVLLVGILLSNLRNLEWFGIIFPIGILYTMYAEILYKNFDIVKIDFWPVMGICMLISIGLSILIHKKPRRISYDFDINGREYRYDSQKSSSSDQVFEGEYEETIINEDGERTERSQHSETSEDNFVYSAKLNSATKYVYSNNFKRAELYCSMADLKVYFNQAVLNEQGAEIYVSCSLGSIELYLPKHWRVNDQVSATLGDVKDYTRTNEVYGPMVNIVGNVNLGDLKIIYI